MAIPSRIILYQLNDQTVEVDKVKDSLTGAYLNAASVTVTLYDSSGSPVTELTSITLGYVTDSNGKYQGNVDQTFNPALGDNYEIWFEIGQGGSAAHLEIPCSVQARAS